MDRFADVKNHFYDERELMLKNGKLSDALQVYFLDAERCCSKKAYWCLLHVIVCLPDICTALESNDGKATGDKYRKWCNRYFRHQFLNGAERYEMRCKLLHQGRARTKATIRYSRFEFGQPASSGHCDHMRVDGKTLHVDVTNLYGETRIAIREWVKDMESGPNSQRATNVARHLTSLVTVANKQVTTGVSGGPIPIVTTTYSKTS